MSARFGGLLVGLTLVMLAMLPRGPVAPQPRFDAPEAAARYAEARRAALVPGFDTSAAYLSSLSQVDRLPRFSSRLGRRLPEAQNPSRVWIAGGRVVPLAPDASATALLDAWTPLGPGNIGGRTRVIRYHPVQHDTLFAAGVSGGIWRSDDSGATWRPLPAGLANVAVNSFAIDPREPDIMYAGTGEGYFREEIRNTGLPLRGGGIFTTRNGGASWQRIAATASRDFYWVNDLELGVGDSRHIYAATRTGVWRSLDAGATWTPLIETSVRGGCLDLALRPDRTEDVLFASCGSYEQATVYRIVRANADARVEAVLHEPGMGRTSLAIAPSNPDVIYALSASNDPGPRDLYRQGLLAVYRSDRGGTAGSWETRVTNNDPQRLNTLLLTNVGAATLEDCGAPAGRNSYINMGWYINVIAVDPRDPERVWAAGVDWLRSDDGGRTWGLVSSMALPPTAAQTPVHVDQHGIAFHPAYDGVANQTLIVGNDGGLYRTHNARARATSGPRAACSPVSLALGWESLNHGYGVTQFYHGAPFPDGTRYLGGAQDNGTVVGSDDAGVDGWRMVFGGDGGHVAIDPVNPQTIYVETQWANIVKSVNGGAQFTSARRGLDSVRSDVLGPEANYLFVSPFVMDPSDSRRLWVGGDYLYRTSNGAEQWTKASTALPDSGLTSAIAVAAGDGNRVIAGTSKGDALTSRQALTATAQSEWAVARPRAGWVTSVTFDPQNADIVYATYGNFGGGHVYRSDDGGITWRELPGAPDSALPDIPVHSLVVDPDDSSRIYLGTDLGVFVSADGGQRWMVEETGFGPIVTEWLSLLRDSSGRKRLFAFTHGRGAWRVDLR
jgi:hypothetical protein